jgi:hypothetical protein
MRFKNWLKIDEQATFSVRQRMTIPCAKIALGNTGGVKLPCQDGPVGMMDIRFEDPGAFPPPYNKLSNGSFFSALLPDRVNEYLVYHGGRKDAEIMPVGQAVEMKYIPVDEKQQIDHKPGAVSEKGYYLIPDDWYIHAQVLSQDYEIIKPALADINGKRAQALG